MKPHSFNFSMNLRQRIVESYGNGEGAILTLNISDGPTWHRCPSTPNTRLIYTVVLTTVCGSSPRPLLPLEYYGRLSDRPEIEGNRGTVLGQSLGIAP